MVYISILFCYLLFLCFLFLMFITKRKCIFAYSSHIYYLQKYCMCIVAPTKSSVFFPENYNLSQLFGDGDDDDDERKGCICFLLDR